MWWTTSRLTDGSCFDVQTTVRNFSSRQLYAALACPGPSLLAGLVAWAEEEAGPALAGKVLAGPVLAGPAVCGGEETTPAMSGPAVRATGEVHQGRHAQLHKADHHRRRGQAGPRLTGELPVHAI